MRLLANENFPGDAILALREVGHDVLWVRTEAPGSPDTVVLAQAEREKRILITFDKDFGELAFRAKLPVTAGIILFRISMPSAQYVATMAVAALAGRDDWSGHFSVVEDGRVRMTPLPKK
jgi:predicted nuclease of predicted toxin-antitoxin system